MAIILPDNQQHLNVTTHEGKIVIQMNRAFQELVFEPQDAIVLARALLGQAQEALKSRGHSPGVLS